MKINFTNECLILFETKIFTGTEDKTYQWKDISFYWANRSNVEGSAAGQNEGGNEILDSGHAQVAGH